MVLKPMNRRQILAGGGMAALLGARSFAWAQEFPEPGKNATFISISALGGPTDASIRLLTEALSQRLGIKVLVDVKAGANGAIGFGELVRSPPDGYTLAFGGVSAASTMWLRPDSQLPFNGSDFFPICTLTSDPVILAVPADSPYKNLKDLVAAARDKPGAVRAGTTGNLGVTAFVGMLLEQAADIKLTLVPFTGAADTAAAVAGKQIEAGFVTTTPAKPLVESKNLRIIAYFDSSPEMKAFPGLQSAVSQGFDIDYPVVTGVFLPKGAPESIQKYWSNAIGDLMADASFTGKLAQVAAPAYRNLEESLDFWAKTQENTKKLVELARSRESR
jgi:putative tricarboxylic transport membrane protein